MLVKSLRAKDHIEHLRQTFNILEKYQMRFNPTKYTLDVTIDKFIKHLVTKHGIEANRGQIKTLINMSAPKNKK